MERGTYVDAVERFVKPSNRRDEVRRKTQYGPSDKWRVKDKAPKRGLLRLLVLYIKKAARV